MKKAMALSFLVVLLLGFSSGGLSFKDFYGRRGICFDKFDMRMGPECNHETCKALCLSKHLDRFYGGRCLDDITCECTHFCRPHA